MTKRQSELFPELPSDKKYVSDYPELVAEWHPTKNGDKHPDDYTAWLEPESLVASASMVTNIKPRCIAELMEVDAESASMPREAS